MCINTNEVKYLAGLIQYIAYSPALVQSHIAKRLGIPIVGHWRSDLLNYGHQRLNVLLHLSYWIWDGFFFLFLIIGIRMRF